MSQQLNMHMLRESFRIHLQYHDQLNPKLWVENDLDPDVRGHLMAIADKWREFAHIPEDAVEDIIITGGNVNYNYTDLSDIDIHFVIDYEMMEIPNKDILRDYLMSKKNLWAKKHETLRVRGYPVEIFAEDIHKNTPSGQGVYSILHGKWVTKPQHHVMDWENDRLLRQQIAKAVKEIKQITAGRRSLEDAESYSDSLKSARASSIQQDGEFARDNLVFKDLRNRGLLDKLKKYIVSAKDAKLSLH